MAVLQYGFIYKNRWGGGEEPDGRLGGGQFANPFNWLTLRSFQYSLRIFLVCQRTAFHFHFVYLALICGHLGYVQL